jgi:hypothetical protein
MLPMWYGSIISNFQIEHLCRYLGHCFGYFQNIGQFSSHPACRQQRELKVLSTLRPGRCAGWTGHWGPELKFGWKCSNPSLPPDGDPPPSSPPSPCPSSPTRPRPDRVSLRCRREVLTRRDFKLFFFAGDVKAK